jgi:hypothetical protein
MTASIYVLLDLYIHLVTPKMASISFRGEAPLRARYGSFPTLIFNEI